MNNPKLVLVQGDITKMKVDAIVNAANSGLRGGGGVDGAIHRAAGPRLHEECMQIIAKRGELATSYAVATSGGNLAAKYVIHAVGPVWGRHSGSESLLLGETYRSSLKAAIEKKAKTIAFPNISTGIYGFPKDLAAEIAINEVDSFISEHDFFEKIYFVCFEQDNYEIYFSLLN